MIDFNQFGTPMDFNANSSRNINETNQAGANLKWDATEHLKFEADACLAREPSRTLAGRRRRQHGHRLRRLQRRIRWCRSAARAGV